ncbi:MULTISPECIES: hypothetical protein [Streptomyces]|uniref:hypothetical protein n=1 Tax=Streptomyces TaxID=1883 RepID=UPI00167570D2|nr:MULTISPECIES: hypothetical protein [Streptomyces]MBD3576043.1 hypothetical protein [Streptomyces sp. KD18]GGS96617.1 hypothetical protein GCM10010286_21890 [Streptomyces toxytricini]
MGIYVVSVAEEDRGDSEIRGPVLDALHGELERRGLAFAERPAARGPARRPGLLGRLGLRGRPAGRGGRADGFAEKADRPYGAFEALCRAQPDGSRLYDALLDWELLVPADFGGVLELSVPAEPGGDGARVRSAHRAAGAARRLAAVLELPDCVPRDAGPLALTGWFAGPAAGRAAAAHPGPWQESPDAAYYTALYLGAAEHALRRGRVIAYG